MAEQTYHLVFRGEVLEGQHASVVCKRVAALLKMDPEKAKALFSGKPVVLKRDAPKAVAAKFQGAFKKAGARLRVVPVEGESAAPAKAPDSAPAPDRRPDRSAERASSKTAEQVRAEPARAAGDGAPKKMSLAERLAAEEAEQASAGAAKAAESVGDPAAAPGRPGADLVPDDAPGVDAFDLAPREGDLVAADEVARPAPVEVDTSHLSAEQSSLEDVAPQRSPLPPPDTSALSLDESGADLVEAREVPEPDLDLSAFSVAEPGAERIEDDRPPPPPAPDPDFSLAEAGADVGELAKPPPPPAPDTSHLSLDP